jgi:hypothetical protein
MEASPDFSKLKDGLGHKQGIVRFLKWIWEEFWGYPDLIAQTENADAAARRANPKQSDPKVTLEAKQFWGVPRPRSPKLKMPTPLLGEQTPNNPIRKSQQIKECDGNQN